MNIAAVVVLSLLSAWSSGWDARGLVWGLWVSTFLTMWGLAFDGLIHDLRTAKAQRYLPSPADPNKKVATTGSLLIISAVFTFFYFAYALGFNDFFPRYSFANDMGKHPVVALGKIIVHLWPVALIAFVTPLALSLVEKPTNEKYEAVVPTFLKFHASMFVMILLGLAKVPPIGLYAVFVIAFLPYGEIKKLKRQ